MPFKLQTSQYMLFIEDTPALIAVMLGKYLLNEQQEANTAT